MLFLRRNHLPLILAFVLIASASTVSPSQVSAAVPDSINFQGVLKNVAGAPVPDASYSITFSIYDAATGGLQLWTETQSVTTSGGLFTVFLGSVTPLPDAVSSGPHRFVGIQVNPDAEMAQRIPLASVAFAQRVGMVDGSSIEFGPGNSVVGQSAFAAGESDTASGNWSTVGGGQGNVASAEHGVVGGGFQNMAIGGINDTTLDTTGSEFSMVAEAFAPGIGATVSGGASNVATGDYSSIGGGRYNQAKGAYSVIAGGGWDADWVGNLAEGPFSTVGGGVNNQAKGHGTVVGGGTGARALQAGSTIAGGGGNSALGFYASVGGGSQNEAGSYPLGQYATVPGGQLNKASAAYSFAAGRRAKALSSGVFVWADATNADFASTGFNQFLIRAGGGVGINTNSPTTGTALDVNGTAKVNGFRMTTNATDGYVLTTDATGVGTWQPAAAGSVPGGATGSVQFNSSGAFGGDEASLFWDNSNKRLGIGTASLSQTLEVNGNISVRGTHLVYNSASGVIDWGNGTNGDLFFRTLSTQGNVATFTNRAVIKNNGDVGIGTGSPASLLSVGAASQFQVTSTGNLAKINNIPYSFPSSQGTALTVLQNDGSGNLAWATAVGGSGDITGVTAGTGLTGGGLSGDVSIAIANDGVTTDMIADQTISFDDIGENNAADGDVMMWDGVGLAWVAGGGFLPLDGGDMTGDITSTGDPSITMGKGSFGLSNSNTGIAAFVAGDGNTASGNRSCVGGGSNNSATLDHSAIGGGADNISSGNWSTVPGGYQNTAGGDVSFAAGEKASALHNYSFVWNGSGDGDGTVSSGDGQVVFHADGGIWLGNDHNVSITAGDFITTSTGGHLTTDGDWVNASDMNKKENFSAIDQTKLLAKVMALPITQWNYKGSTPSRQHIGPTAQDFEAAFGLGGDGKSISTIDPAGVALAAIQALNEKFNEQQAENDLLRAQIVELRELIKARDRAEK